MKRKLTGLLIVLVMCLTLVPASPASAATYDGRSASGEPKCTGWFWSNCNSRNLYRNVYWGTNAGNPADVKAALLMVMTPVNRSYQNGRLESTLANVYPNINARNARCVHGNLLKFMRSQGATTALTQNVADTFGVAKKVARYGGPWSGALRSYMNAGTKLSKVAGRITVSTNAYGHMLNAMSCR